MMTVFIISLSLALLVLLGGLFLLGYAKKEGLGMMSKIASYVAIVFGTFVFVSGLICSVTCGGCGEGKCGEGEKCERRIEIHKEMRGDCHEGMKGGHCEMEEMECHEGMEGGHCEKGDMKCSKSDEACCKEGKGECKNSDKDCCKAKEAKKVVEKKVEATPKTEEKAQ